MQHESRAVGAGSSSRKAFNATFATSKRQERDLSASKVAEKNPMNLGAEITEITGKSRIFGKINSNMRGGVQINMEPPTISRSPKSKVKNSQVRDEILKNLGSNLSHKEKSNSPRRREDRGSSFIEILSSGSSSKGTGSSGSSGRSNTSLILENDDGASSSDAGVSSDFSNGRCNRPHASSSDIADEDEDEGDGIISLGKMKWFYELNEKQDSEP